MSAEEFWALIGTQEHERVDFKSRPPGGLKEVFPAMAMTDGGIVALGVTDARELRGCLLDQRARDQVSDAAHITGVDVQMRQVEVDGTPILLVAIPAITGRIVTTPDGRLLRRVGSSNRPLVGDALARFVLQRDERPAEDERVTVFDPDEFDLALVNEALANDARPPIGRTELLRGLMDLGVAEPAPPPNDPFVTNAAVLLFANDPRRHLKGAAIQVVRRVGPGPGPAATKAREDFSGPLPQLAERALDFIGRHTDSFEAVVGRTRTRIPEYPEEVLREAVLNALAHRDYGLPGATVDITVWDDRVEIRSPGSLPGHVTVENIREEHYSRNRRIMRVLKQLDLVEECGDGVDRMIDGMEARLMEAPQFVATPSSVTVVLKNRSLVSLEDQVWLGVLGDLDLTTGERRALVEARHKGEVTPRRLRQLMPDSEAGSVLRGAVLKGLLVRVGRAGGSRYVLSDEIVLRAGTRGIQARERRRQTLLEELRRRGSLSTAEAAEFLEEGDKVSIRRLLKDLVRAGLAREEGVKRGRRYLAT